MVGLHPHLQFGASGRLSRKREEKQIEKWDRVTELKKGELPNPVLAPSYLAQASARCGHPHLFCPRCGMVGISSSDFGKYLNEGFEQFGRLIKEFNIKLE